MPDAELLKGKHVAVTGRLASVTRTEAAELIRAHGGFFVSTVSRRTSFLVVGQDGWPVQNDGRLTSQLRKARLLQRAGHEITILSEEDLLARIGLEQQAEAGRQLFSSVQLCRLLKVPGKRLRQWVSEGLIHPFHTVNGISHFDYSQVVSAKTLWDLMQRGVKADQLRRSIQQLKRWLPDLEQPLLQLAVLERNGELMVRLDDGLVEPTGQGCFDFVDPVHQPTLCLSQSSRSAEDWFQLACAHEDAGQLQEATQAYRQALQIGGPNASLCFNLANALCGLGMKAEAVERFYQAVEIDRAFAEAWNNLGVVLTDLGRTDEAMTAFVQALTANPDLADAHYNLADLKEEMGQSDAIAHWEAYLSQDGQSLWASHARERLAAIGT